MIERAEIPQAPAEQEAYPADASAAVLPSLPALALMAWLSPSFPVGSFSFSHAIEWDVEAGDVKNAATAISWIGTLLVHGGPRNDAILLANAWRAMNSDDHDHLAEINVLAIALAGSRERRLETTAQGNAFLAAIRSAWHEPAIDRATANLDGDLAYPVSVAIATAAHGIPLAPTLEAFCLALVQNLVSATIRLGAIGHTDGQRTVAALLPAAIDLAAKAQHLTLDDVGAAAFRSDIAALRHETQYTRLFRS
jgi:urease accessory protein